LPGRPALDSPLIGIGQVGADVVSVGDAEVGVEGKRLTPVAVGRVELVAGAVGVGKSVVGTGLLVAVADLGGQGERGEVVVAGQLGVSGGIVGLARAVQGLGFAERTADRDRPAGPARGSSRGSGTPRSCTAGSGTWRS
jgi:hypothetical protein